MNDLGNHIIADEKLGTINWYSDIPEILMNKGYIDAGLREKCLQMIGFRNILVYEYLEIDRQIVFDILHNHLPDLEELRAVFARFL